jgi:hypothetical protein
MESGKYRKQFKFANFGSVVEDSIVAQQMYADQKLKQIQLKLSQREARA